MSHGMLLSFPVDIELRVILCYVAAVLAGARIVEALARAHFARAQRYSEQGFEYLEAHDVYRCPQGEHLSFHSLQHRGRLAVYKAPAASCRQCRVKARCAPSSEGRLVFRSMAVWAETDVGVFHRRVSLVMFAAACVVCAVALWRWAGQAGWGWIAGALVAGTTLLIRDVRTIADMPERTEGKRIGR